MSDFGQLSDLVRDSRIETEFRGDEFTHVFYDSGSSARERRIRREELWQRQDRIGRGTYGTVYLERCICDDFRRRRAVKEIKMHDRREYARELEAVAKFSHKKVNAPADIPIRSSFGWFERHDTLFIAMEYLEHGSFHDYLFPPLPEVEVAEITSQILEGLSYMHGNGFAHRDLKPENILVVERGPDWFVKIADFGISKRRPEGITAFNTLNRGTPGFAAPEVYRSMFHGEYTFAVDMWSLGSLVFTALTNTIAFPDESELFKYFYRRQRFPKAELERSNISTLAQDFIFKLMEPHPKDRLTVEHARGHPWLPRQPSDDPETPPSPSFVPRPEPSTWTWDSRASKDWSTEELFGHDRVKDDSPTLFQATMNETDEMAMTVLFDPAKREPNVVSDKDPVKHLRVSNYKKPSLVDCSEDTAIDHELKLPGDSAILIEVIEIPDADTPASNEKMKRDNICTTEDIKEIQTDPSFHEVTHIESAQKPATILECCPYIRMSTTPIELAGQPPTITGPESYDRLSMTPIESAAGASNKDVQNPCIGPALEVAAGHQANSRDASERRDTGFSTQPTPEKETQIDLLEFSMDPEVLVDETSESSSSHLSLQSDGYTTTQLFQNSWSSVCSQSEESSEASLRSQISFSSFEDLSSLSLVTGINRIGVISQNQPEILHEDSLSPPSPEAPPHYEMPSQPSEIAYIDKDSPELKGWCHAVWLALRAWKIPPAGNDIQECDNEGEASMSEGEEPIICVSDLQDAPLQHPLAEGLLQGESQVMKDGADPYHIPSEIKRRSHIEKVKLPQSLGHRLRVLADRGSNVLDTISRLSTRAATKADSSAQEPAPELVSQRGKFHPVGSYATMKNPSQSTTPQCR
ncbi:hypothetical protein TruAng_011364 [Truncatella angustata]|nr:hypothetical protein TruAng_011364 [Truncatella angustata]